MELRGKKKKVWQSDIFAGCLVGVIALAAVYVLLQLWSVNWNVPLYYGNGDYLTGLTSMKSLKELGKFAEWPRLGAPFGAAGYEFPSYGDALHIFELFLLTRIFSPVVAYNMFFILLFPATAVIFYFVMRSLRVSNIIAAVCGLCYTFLPYRFLRNQAHLFLSAYSMVPLTVLLAYWIFADDEFLSFKRGMLKYKRNWYAVFMLVASALSGMYYAFFTCFFLVLVSAIKWLYNWKNWKVLLKGAFGCGVIAISILLARIPTMLYLAKHGKSAWEVGRSVVEVEFYALKITRLLLPYKTHGLAILEEIQKNFSSHSLISGEGSEYLGFFGVIGFLILMVFIFVPASKIFKSEEDANKISLLAKMNLGAVLLSTISGFGLLFALFVSPLIRAYGRISVFIACFALVALGITVDVFSKKLKVPAKVAILVAFALLGGMSIREQAIVDIAGRQAAAFSWKSDKEFVGKIEQEMPKGALIFQLPFLMYPEGSPTWDYSPMRGYIHSDALRFSYGNFRGRPEYYWQEALAALPLEEQLKSISIAGFEGIWIDTFGYKETNPEGLEPLLQGLQEKVGGTPIVSEDGRFIFYSLEEYVEKLKQEYSEAEWETLQQQALALPAQTA